jgi:hypothetical protein
VRRARRCFRDQHHQPGGRGGQRAARLGAAERDSGAGRAAGGIAPQLARLHARQHRAGLRPGGANPAPDQHHQRPGQPAQMPVPRDQATQHLEGGGEMVSGKGGVHVRFSNMWGVGWAR